MPLYEYKCDRCEKVIEAIQKFSNAPLTVHEGCGGSLEKLFSSPAFQFKGSGFYITDYAKGKGGGPNGKHSSSKSESSSSDSAKSDSSKSDSSASSSESKPAATPSTSASSSESKK